MEIIINDIKSALEAAKLKHPDWSKYTIQDMALIVSEEAGEISKAVVDFKLMEKVPLEEVQMELLQTAAMCLRMLENIEMIPLPLSRLKAGLSI
jgi:NTP pyrophosphatase (non-canonical NTP hydrolase)